MDLKHSPEEAFEQTPWQHCLQEWCAGPMGQRVRQLLLDEIRHRCTLRYGDWLLQLGPVDLLPVAALQPAWVLRLSPEHGDVLADLDFLPMAPESFAGILLVRCGPLSEYPAQAVAEAARVLAPEGHLFLLETTVCRPQRGLRWTRAVLPAGLRRRENREQLEAAGLEVRRQLALTLLPGALPLRWQQALAGADARVARWLPAVASCVLTVAQRRQPLSLTGGRWRWSGQPARAAGNSQWAWRRR